MKKNVLFLLLLMSSLAIQAQWTTDTAANTLVANSSVGDIKSITTSEGSTYLVFWKSVQAPVNFELRMQVMDSEGNKTLGEDGVLVSDEIPMGTFTVFWNLAIDNNDNLFIGLTGTGDEAAYVFKMDMQGNSLWGLKQVSSTGYQVVPFPLSNGETAVAWFPTNDKCSIQKFDANGNAIWDTPTMIGNNTRTAPGDLFELSDGSIEMVYHEVMGNGVASTLYAQRIAPNGSKMWENPVQLSDKQTVFNTYFSPAQDGDIVYYGYKAASGNRFDSFVQRINPDGTIPWGMNGADFDTSNAYYEQETQIGIESSGQYVWSICDYTDSSQGQRGVYVQKFDKETGERQFTDTAKELTPVNGENLSRKIGKVRMVNNQPLFLMLTGTLLDTTINIAYLDENGDFAWENELEPIATAAGEKKRVSLGKVVNGQVVASFVQESDDEDKAFVQNFTSPDLVFSVQDKNFEEFTYYPNPVKDRMMLKANSAIQQITIYNLLGQKVIENYPKASLTNVEMSQLREGVYLMKVNVNGSIKSFKVIKK